MPLMLSLLMHVPVKAWVQSQAKVATTYQPWLHIGWQDKGEVSLKATLSRDRTPDATPHMVWPLDKLADNETIHFSGQKFAVNQSYRLQSPAQPGAHLPCCQTYGI